MKSAGWCAYMQSSQIFLCYLVNLGRVRPVEAVEGLLDEWYGGYHRVQIFLILIQEADCFYNGKQRNIRYVVSLKIRTYRRAENVWGFVFLGE